MKNFCFLRNRCYDHCILPISITTIVRRTNRFLKIMQLISPNYNLGNGVKQIKITEEKLSHSCILCCIAKNKDPSTRVKMHQFFYFIFWTLPPFVLLSECDIFEFFYCTHCDMYKFWKVTFPVITSLMWIFVRICHLLHLFIRYTIYDFLYW